MSGRIFRHISGKLRERDYSRSGQEAVMSCPECPPGKSAKLYVNLETGAYICFRCDLRGRQVRFGFVDSLPQSPSRRTSPAPPKDFAPREIGPRLLAAKGALALRARRYLRGRGIVDEEIEETDARLHPPYVGFPVYDSDGKCVGWQGRRFVGTGNKYFTPGWFKKSSSLYGIERHDGRGGPAVLVEGIFDVIAGRRVSDSVLWCCPFGSSVGEEQVKLLFGVAGKGVVVLFDADAQTKAKAAWRKIGIAIPTVFQRRARPEDIDELPAREIRRMVRPSIKRVKALAKTRRFGYSSVV